jgi:hypothetical protein
MILLGEVGIVLSLNRVGASCTAARDTRDPLIGTTARIAADDCFSTVS